MSDKKTAGTILLIVATVVALYICYLIFRPYATPILFACVICIVFFPLHRQIRRRVRNPSASALISTIVTLALSVVPLTFLFLSISKELAQLYASLTVKSADAGGVIPYLLDGSSRLIDWLNQRIPLPDIDLNAALLRSLQNASASMVKLGANLVGNVFIFFVDSIIALIILFFLYRDGEKAVSKMMDILPLSDERLAELRTRIGSTVVANFNGGVVIGAIQGTLTGLSFWFLGLDSPVLWGSVAGIMSLIPILGSSVVWGPACLVLLLTHHGWKALILLLVGSVLISTVDNIVRPMIIRRSAHLHAILIFFALLGGVQLFGLLGLFVGPVVLSVTAALVGMVQEDLTARHRSSKKGALAD